MDRQPIDLKDLYFELKNQPSENDKDLSAWYDSNLKKQTEIRKVKSGFKILVITLSGLLFLFSFFPNLTDFWLRIIQFISFSLMVSIWIFLKHESINPDKNLLIMKIINKTTNNSKR